jgi:hypothetical protein
MVVLPDILVAIPISEHKVKIYSNISYISQDPFVRYCHVLLLQPCQVVSELGAEISGELETLETKNEPN